MKFYQVSIKVHLAQKYASQMEPKKTFAIGHIAIGYLSGKASAKLLNVKTNIPLLFTLSVLPDIDLLLPMLQHGGPTHSIITILIIALPAILLWKERTAPYLVALVSHPLLGDYLTRVSRTQGVQLLYPINTTWFFAGSVTAGFTYIYLELALFSAFIALMITTKDMAKLTKPHTSNLLLAIPILTTWLPAFAHFPIPVPSELIIPHFILIVILALPALADVKHATQ